jgi:alcohol dehydrogenase class IV
MSRLNRELSAGWQQDPEYLLRVKAACCLGTYAYLAAGALAVNTAMAHQIGAICDVPHGVANAILLPHTIRFNAVAGASQLQLVAKAFELDPDRSAEHVAAAIADRVASLCAGLEIPSRLRDVGVSPDQFEAIALATLGDHLLSGNPTPVHGPEAIVGILERAW